MWCVPSYRPRATVSLLLALRDEGRVAGADQRVRRTRGGRAIDRGSGPALRVVLPAGRGRASASARRNLGDDSRVILDLPRSSARKSGSRSRFSCIVLLILYARISSNT